MKAAIYARTASQEQSTTSQIELCREYILEQGGVVTCIFDDEGVSAHTTERDGLETLLAAAAQKKFNTLVVTGLDRFYRDNILQHGFINQMELLEISLITVKRMANT